MLLTETGDYAPDTVVYVGGNMVSKSMRTFLQGCRPANSYVVTADGKLTDVLMTATDIVEATPSQALDALVAALNDVLEATEIPAANEVQCGNWRDLSLEGAKTDARKALEAGFSLDPFERV